MTIDLKKEQRKIVANLQAIFNAPSMKNALSQNNLQSIIEKQLNILAYLEKTNKSKTIKSNNLLDTYNKLTNKHFTIDKNLNFADKEVLVDDINYLSVYIRNIYKIDLEALASGKEVKITAPTVSDATPQPAAQANPFPFMMPGMMGNLPPEQNPMYTAMANARLQQESAQGKVYLFKTKPKYMPLLKWAISGLLFLFCLSALFIGIGMLCAQGSARFSDDANNALNIMTALPYFLLVLIGMFVCYRTFSPLLKGTKNENRIYSFQWQIYLVLAMLLAFLLIFGGALGVDLWIFKSSIVPWATPTDVSSTHMFGLWAWFIGYVLLITCTVLLIVAIAFGSVKGPKVDTERLNALMRQYIDESIKTPPPTSPPVGA